MSLMNMPGMFMDGTPYNPMEKTRSQTLTESAAVPTTEQQVYETVKTMIFERELTPGSQIRQEELRQQFGVSQAVLVNALRRLEKELLLTSMQETFYIRLFSRPELVRIFEIRILLEGLTAKWLALDGTSEQLQQVQTFFQEFAIGKSLNEKRYAEEDRRFHLFLIEHGGKGVLADMMLAYNILPLSYRLILHEGLVRTPQDTLPEHRTIIEAICRKDGVQAEAAMHRHLDASRASLLKRC